MPGETTLQESQRSWPVRLLQGASSASRALGVNPSAAPLSAAELMATARKRAALDDFGLGDVLEPLSRLLDSCHREAKLNVIGRIALRADTLHCLRNRLLLERDRRDVPQIAHEKIRAPLFIVGLPRTGTTILHTLLMADPEHRAPLTWEVMEPSPLGDEQKQSRVRRATRSLACLGWLAPAFPQVHAVGAELPQECVSVMSLSFLSDQFDTMYNIPSYRAWFLGQELSSAYEWHRRFLQHRQFRSKPARWILKAPAHMFALPTLLSTYPDAQFVQTHRAPLDAMTSVSSLITILRRIFSDAVDPVEIGREAMRYWARTLADFLKERAHLSPARICDLHYRDLKRDPIEAIRRVYTHFEWSLSPEVEARMRHILATQPPGQVGFHRYEPSQFGLAPDEMARLFASYCERFELPVHEGRPGATQLLTVEPVPAKASEFSPTEGVSASEGGAQRRATIG